jgi:hypothetical protein
VKSTWEADFAYFPSAENKERFGDYFSKSKWMKSSLEAGLKFRRCGPAGDAINSGDNSAFQRPEIYRSMREDI